jgi:3',5'-cyclic AMP phosphodiesterase CpdA
VALCKRTAHKSREQDVSVASPRTNRSRRTLPPVRTKMTVTGYLQQTHVPVRKGETVFEELEERFHDILARVRREPPPAPAPGSGRIIREVMDPSFLKTQLDVVREAAAKRQGGQQLPEAAYQDAYKELEEAAAARPQVPFMPRTSTGSNLQSIISTCIESRADRLLRAAPEGLSRLAHAILSDDEIFRAFGPCDPLWIETKLAEGWSMIDGRPGFPDSPADPVALAPDARVIIVGDWGTGLPGAVAVAEQIRKRIDAGRGRQQHLVHLGDVYYSGWREEYETRFLPYWPVDRDEQDVLCWALNGNHDMYSGGHGYFGYLLHDPRFRGQWRGAPADHTPSSYFSLENEDWQLLGLDSAYLDHDLAGSQAEWVAGKLGNGRKTMLLTHHQPFSAYETVGQAMTRKITQTLGDIILDAWIWGHEHRCTVYSDRRVPWLQFGSCVGNGGVPQQLPDPPLQGSQNEREGYAPLTWAYDGAETADENEWLRFGFAVLDLDGPRITIEYVDEHGDTAEQVTLS